MGQGPSPGVNCFPQQLSRGAREPLGPFHAGHCRRHSTMPLAARPERCPHPRSRAAASPFCWRCNQDFSQLFKNKSPLPRQHAATWHAAARRQEGSQGQGAVGPGPWLWPLIPLAPPQQQGGGRGHTEPPHLLFRLGCGAAAAGGWAGSIISGPPCAAEAGQSGPEHSSN